MIGFLDRKRLATALLLPLFVVAGLAPTGELLLCDMQGYTKACCCQHEASDATAAFSRPSCCAPVATVVAPLQTAEQRPAQLAPPVVLVVGRIDAHVSREQRVAFVAGVRADVARAEVGRSTTTGPPLFIQNRALLI